MVWHEAGELVKRADIFNGVSLIVRGLNWLFLVEMITVLVAVLFYLFYLSRVLGSFIGTALTWLFLFRRYNVHLEFESIQFSPLGGRISFKDLRYVSRNQSLRVQTGHLTLRYWFWRVRDNKHDASKEGLPCRVKVEFEGLEWFVYNRTPSYDAIIDHIVDNTVAPLGEKRTTSKTVGRTSNKTSQPDTAPLLKEHPGLNAWWADFLPVQIVCRTGAIVLGNRATPTLLITGFSHARGVYCVSQSRSTCDFYKEIYDFRFDKPKAVWRSNPDYDESMLKHGQRLHAEMSGRSDIDVDQTPSNLRFPRFNRILRAMTGFTLRDVRAEPFFAKSTHKKWQGLERYQTQDEPYDPEYARVNTLLECPELHLRYYCDAAGKVPEVPIVVPGLAGLESVDIGNGDLSPEWGVDVEIKGGSVNYGPWTDRQRTALQSVFTPSSFFDQVETPKLQPGEARRHSSMKIFIEFSDHTKFRVPTREPSKDWQWDGQLQRHFSASQVRHYGWLDAYLGGNSSINFALPMVAGPNGFDVLLEVHVDSLSVFCSSAPDAPIISSDVGRVSVQMPSPLKWNDVRRWTIGISLSRTNIRLLREYANLFGDTVQDFVSGPPGDPEHFVPMVYHIDLQLKDYEVAVYLNQHNVVTIPGMESDNTMLHMNGHRIVASVDVSSEVHQPSMSEVHFDVKADPLTMGITVPLWNTHAAFTTPRTAKFGMIPELSLDGTYIYYASYHPDLVETLYLNIKSRKLVFKTLGWCIRYLINIRDNYFGNFTHRLTAQEFAQQRPRQHPDDADEGKVHHHRVGDPVEEKFRPGRKNAYEVLLSVDVSDATLVVPDTTYDCRAGLMLFVPDAQIHLRNHDLFMEMSANFDPMSAILTSDTEHWLSLGRMPLEHEQKPHLLVDGLDIFGHRMFGHQPRGSTYMCNWEITTGRISGLLKPDDIVMIGRIDTAMRLSLPDHDNTLAPEFAVTGDPDGNLFAVSIGAVDIIIEGQESCKAVLSASEGVHVRTDDIPCERFMSHVEVDIPAISAKALTPSDLRTQNWMEVASIELDVLLTIGASVTGWEASKAIKLAYIREQDAATERCAFAYRAEPPEAAASHVGRLFCPFLPVSRVKHEGPPTMALSPISLASPAPMQMAKTTTGDESGVESNLSPASRRHSPAESPTRERFSVDGPHQAYRRVLPSFQRVRDGVDGRRDGPSFVPRCGTTRSEPGRQLPDPVSRLYGAFSEAQKPTLKGEKAAFVRVDSRKGISVHMTPLAAVHVDNMMAAQCSSFDVEHWLDSIHGAYVALRTTPAYRPRSLHLAIYPARLSVSTFQDVLQAEEPSTPEQTRRASYFSRPDSEILSSIELEIKEPSATVSLRSTVAARPLQAIADGEAYQHVSASLGTISLKVFHAEVPDFTALSSDRSSTESVHSTAPVLDVCWSDMKLTLEMSSKVLQPAVDLGAIQVDFAESAAELILGSQVAWQRALAKPMRHIRRNRDLNTLRQRHVFMLLAGYLERDPSQPVFLTRGSPLLDWTSTSLRFDRGWQALVNLRQGLLTTPEEFERFTDDQMRATAARSPQDLLAEAEVLLASWRSWERGDDAVIESELLAQVFGSVVYLPASSFSLPQGAKQAAGHVKLPSITVNLLDLSQAFNCAYLRGLNVTAGLRYDAVTDEIAVAGKITVDDVSAQANPDLLALVKHIVQVQAIFEQKRQANMASERRKSLASPLSPRVIQGPGAFRPNLHVSCSLLLRKISVKTEAHGMLATGTLSDVRSLLDARLREEHFGVSVFFGFESLEVSTMETVKFETAPPTPDKVLAMVILQGPRAHLQVEDVHVARLYIGVHDKAPLAPKISVAINSGTFTLRVLRNVLRLHEFAKDWSTEALPKSRFVLQELRQDLSLARSPVKQRRRTGSVSSTYMRSARPRWQDIATVQLSLSIEAVAIELQAMPTLRVDYRMGHAYSFGSYRPPPPRSGHHRRRSSQTSITTQFEVGLEIVTQSLHFMPTDSKTQQVVDLQDEIIALPAIKIVVHNKEHMLSILAILERINVHLTAGMLDSILSAQKHFGEDLDELLELVNEKRARGPSTRRLLATASPSRGAAATTHVIPLWTSIHAQIALRGIRVAIDAPLAVQNIYVEVVEASVTKTNAEALTWQLKAADLALYLEQKSALGSHVVERLAYFGIDLTANNRPRAVANLPSVASEKTTEEPPLYLHIQLSRLHAVMQPATIDALGEVVDYYTDEIQARREDRGKEIQQMRVRVKQTLFASDTAPGPSPATLLERMILSVRFENMGLAIPLVEGDIDIPVEMRRLHQRPAFLFAVPSIDFATRKGSAGFAQVVNLSMQFVPVFDQHNKRHYAAEAHETTTSFLLPSMSCTVQPRSIDHRVRHYRADSRVNGLRLDLDPTIASYAFRLIDVFHLSQARFEKLVTAEKLEALGLASPASDAVPKAAKTPPLGSSVISRSASASHKALTLQLTFNFEYGEIHFHPRPAATSRPKHRRTHSQHGYSAGHRREPSFAAPVTMSPAQIVMSPTGMGSTRPKVPVFTLPALSIMSEYRDGHQEQMSDGRSELQVTAVLHGSRNTLYPNILPFFDELMTDVKTRLRRPTLVSSPKLPPDSLQDPAPAALSASVTPQAISRLQLAVSLRIDDSNLTFSCQPEAQVWTSLEWKSGGFLFTMTPGSRSIGFVARINEVGIDLQHVFAAGTGARAVAAHLKGLVASVVLARPDESVDGIERRTLTVSINAPSLIGDINMRQLHDALCAQRVWLDRVVAMKPDERPLPEPRSMPTSARTKSSFAPSLATPGATTLLDVLVAARIENLALTCDMGMVIGTVKAKSENTIARLRLVPGDSKAFSISFDMLETDAEGRLKGAVRLSHSGFSTTLYDQTLEKVKERDELFGIAFRIGELHAALDYDFRRILLAEADPISVTVTDDWRSMTTTGLRLTFRVLMGGFTMLATAQSVPTTIALIQEIERLLDAAVERTNEQFASQGNLRKSKGDAVNAIAAARLKQGTSKKPSMDSLASSNAPGMRISGSLRLEIGKLCLVVFPLHFSDTTVWRIDLTSVSASLLRTMQLDEHIHRVLDLKLVAATANKLTPKKLSAAEERDLDLASWLKQLENRSLTGESNIVRVPAINVSMTSWQLASSAQVEHNYKLHWSSGVTITLNVGLLKETKNLVVEVMQQVTAAIAKRSAARRKVSLPKESDVTLPRVEKPVDVPDATGDGQRTTVTMAQSPLLAAATHTAPVLVYVEREPAQIEHPRLQTLGDATPPVMRSIMARAPAVTHSFVVSSLESLLLILTSTYETQLAARGGEAFFAART